MSKVFTTRLAIAKAYVESALKEIENLPHDDRHDSLEHIIELIAGVLKP